MRPKRSEVLPRYLLRLKQAPTARKCQEVVASAANNMHLTETDLACVRERGTRRIEEIMVVVCQRP